jgi:hypothetical protein
MYAVKPRYDETYVPTLRRSEPSLVAADDKHLPMASPALLLQNAVAAKLTSQTADGKYDVRLRAAIIVGCSLLLWGGLGSVAALILLR